MWPYSERACPPTPTALYAPRVFNSSSPRVGRCKEAACSKMWRWRWYERPSSSPSSSPKIQLQWVGHVLAVSNATSHLSQHGFCPPSDCAAGPAAC